MPAAAFLLSPWLDLACAGETHLTRGDVDLTCTTESLQRMASQYLDGHDPHDPRVSALDADLSGVPPLFVQAGGHEILLDDAVRVVRRRYAGHARHARDLAGDAAFLPGLVGAFPEAQEALTSLGSWLRDRWA